IVLLAACHVHFVFSNKLRVDRDRAAEISLERALRAKAIDVTEIQSAPFGFSGWYLHPYFITHEGKTARDIAGFLKYQRRGAVELHYSPLRFWRDSKTLHRVPEGGSFRVLDGRIFRVGWLWHQRVSLVRPE